VAVIVTEVAAITALVVRLNAAVPAFAATVMEAGTLATVALLLVSFTTTPPVGAAPVRVTVPVLDVPAVTDVGLSVTDDSAGGLTVSTAVLLTPLYVAVIVTDVAVVTALLVAVTVAVVAPAATVIEAGTVAAAVLLVVSVTTVTPFGAAPFRVIVPVLFAPPVTAVGLRDKAESATGFTVSVAVLLTPL
jgi:hypothetical protein